ncbi:MAG: hypothetical protein K2K82_03935 [Muribaculaceae bacterium]|nr:hypothetical protein [Muribaculaceae bacterium]
MQNLLSLSSIPDSPHKVSTGAYMRLVAEEWLLSRGWLVVLPIVGLALAAYHTGDFRLWVVIPVLVCLILPLIMVVIYYKYSLSPEAIASVWPHRVRVSADGSLTLLPEPPAEDSGAAPRHELRVHAKEIKAIDERSSRYIIHLKNKPFRFIIIPKTYPENENL